MNIIYLIYGDLYTRERNVLFIDKFFSLSFGQYFSHDLSILKHAVH